MKKGIIGNILVFSFLALALLVNLAWSFSPTVSADQAHRVADNWLKYLISQKGGWGDALSANLKPVQYLVNAKDTLGYYFEINPTGYILCPSSRELPPITAYSTTAYLQFDDVNSFSSILREVLKEKIKLVDDLKGNLRRYAQAGMDTSEVKMCFTAWELFSEDYSHFSSEVKSSSNNPLDDVQPLVRTDWQQRNPYNYLCPLGNGGTCLAGCIAVAAAQIMKYHNWPTTGTGNPTYFWDGDPPVPGQQLTVDCNDTYDWGNMLQSYEGTYTTEQRDAVAELCYEIGVACHLDYGFHGTGIPPSQFSNVINAYEINFRYNNQITQEERRSYTSGQDWFNMMQTELDFGRPMQYQVVGHSIVCDGWRIFLIFWNQVHMNYGWQGTQDDHWYTVDHLQLGNPSREFLIRNISPEPTPDASAALTPLNPPIQILASGGNFDFTMAFTNNESHELTLQYWTMITKPDASQWGPILGPEYLTLQTGQVSSNNYNQVITATDPPGTYTYTAYVGHYDAVNPEIWDSNQFQFEKQTGGISPLWAATYNGTGSGEDDAYYSIVDDAGNVIVTGNSLGSGTGNDYLTIKYSSSGVQQWVARYNGPGNGEDIPAGIVVDDDGNVYVTGWSDATTGSSTNYDYATIKYSSSGSQQWVSRYNGPANSTDQAQDIEISGDGSIYVFGWRTTVSIYDYALVKYNSGGAQQWVSVYNGAAGDTDYGLRVAIDPTGNPIVTGTSVGSTGGFNFVTVKYNGSGQFQWVSSYNGPGNGEDNIRGIAIDSDGNIIVTGWSEGSGSFFDFATVKYDPNGNQLWAARYNGPGNGWDDVKCLVVDDNDNIYVTGHSVGTGTGPDYTTVKYNPAGNEQWVARYNYSGGGWDEAKSVSLDGNGFIYVTGRSNSSSSGYDYATIKYSPTGGQMWVARYTSNGNYSDEAYSVSSYQSQCIYVTGRIWNVQNNYDFCTIKYTCNNIAGWGEPEAAVLGAQLPGGFRLKQPSPNPFNPSTVLSYELQAASYISLKVYDTAGRLVATLVNGWRDAGAHEVTFDGSRLASGVYVYRLQAGENAATGKMVLLK
jgi:uncharacterized delta-60 repeat protein